MSFFDSFFPVYQPLVQQDYHCKALKKEISLKELQSWELTKRLTLLQQRHLVQSGFEGRSKIENFASRLNSGSGVPILLKKDKECTSMPIQGLQARIYDLITDAQLGTLCLLNQAYDQLIKHRSYIDVRFGEPLRINSNITQVSNGSNAVFNNIFEVYHCSQEGEQANKYLKNYLGFTDAQFVNFTQALKKAPASEQYFYTFRIPLGDTISWSPMYHALCYVLQYHLKKKVWNPVECEGKEFFGLKQRVLVLPSFTMFQNFLNVHCGDHAVTLVPIFGKCTPSTIEKFKLQGKRIVEISLPVAEVEKEADGLYAGRLVYSLHDIYHGFRYSVVKNNEKAALKYINKIFIELRKAQPHNTDLKRLKWSLIDGELHNSVTLGESFGFLFHTPKNRWSLHFKLMIIQDMVEKKEFWNKEFNLTRNDLLPEDGLLYDQLSAKKKIQSKL